MQEAAKLLKLEPYLQRTPHLVLLNVDYYHQDLKPVLARWALLWLAKEGLVVDPTTEPQLLAYLQGSRTAPSQFESGRDSAVKFVQRLAVLLYAALPAEDRPVRLGLYHIPFTINVWVIVASWRWFAVSPLSPP